MKILIIGGNRFVGKLVAQKLLKDNDVTIINRKGTGPDGCTILKGDRNNNSKTYSKNSFGLRHRWYCNMLILEWCRLISFIFLYRCGGYFSFHGRFNLRDWNALGCFDRSFHGLHCRKNKNKMGRVSTLSSVWKSSFGAIFYSSLLGTSLRRFNAIFLSFIY